MTRIEVAVRGTNVYATLHEGPLTDGMVGAEAAYSFDETWQGLNIIAKFRCGSTVKSRSLIAGNGTTVPYEVLQRSGAMLEVGVEGRTDDGSIVIPTVWAEVDRVQPGAGEAAEEGRDPTPTQYDDIMAAINAGKVKGERGSIGPRGETGAPGKDGVDIFTPQDTTDEQKATARENLGIPNQQRIVNGIRETDEFFNGKRVYSVSLDGGAFPNKTNKQITVQALADADVDAIVSIVGCARNGNGRAVNIPFHSASGNFADIFAYSTGEVQLVANWNANSPLCTSQFEIKFTRK